MYSWDNDFSEITSNEQENFSYSLTILDFKKNEIHSDSTYNLVEEYLNAAIDYYIDNPKYKILYGLKVETNGYPGKEFNIKNLNDFCFLRITAYLVNNTLYVLTVQTDEEMANNKSIKRFSNSFKLLNVQKGNYNLKVLDYKKHFSIDFPGNLSHSETSMQETAYGPAEILIEIYSFPSESNNLVFNAYQIKYHNQLNFNNALDSFYVPIINGSIQAINAELLSIKDIELSGCKAKEYIAYMKKGDIEVTGRIVLKNNVLYILSTLGKPNLIDNPEKDKYFNSFKIIEP